MMDSSEVLIDLREAVSEMYGADSESADESAAASRVEHAFVALDAWLSAGGSLPAAWRNGRKE